MFKIKDGREHFYQWDLDRELIVNDPTIKEVHYCNRTDECSLVVDVVDGIAPVPNLILQHSFDVRVFAYDGNATRYEQVFKVKPRTKPADYVYTETEIKTYKQLEARIDEIEKNGISGDVVTEDELAQKGFATEQYVKDAVDNIDIPDVDLSDYYNKTEVDNKLDTKLTASTGDDAIHGYVTVTHKTIGEVWIPIDAGNLNPADSHSCLARRTDKGHINVPTTPTNDIHAASKAYVDGLFANISLAEEGSY